MGMIGVGLNSRQNLGTVAGIANLPELLLVFLPLMFYVYVCTVLKDLQT